MYMYMYMYMCMCMYMYMYMYINDSMQVNSSRSMVSACMLKIGTRNIQGATT